MRATPPGQESGAGRFGQLTYTSFDSGRGAGGWQVKEVRELTDDEAAELTARVSSRLETDPVDRFPTPEQIATLPRRLVYAPLRSGAWAFWHTAPAGVDGSGRPGNVFTHVVLDRFPATGDQVHPIDLWRSPGWLTPFNPEQVVAATLSGAERPASASATPGRDVVEFLLDPEHWRLGVFPALLDAVAGSLAGGPRVVIGVDDADRGAAWVAAVSHFTSAVTARRLAFSTYERADGVRAAVGHGTMLICVPREDLELIPAAADLVVIDEAEIVQTGAVHGEPHVTERGSRIAVTPWSGLARAVTEDGDRAVAVLADMDRIAATVAGDDARAAWPLALAVLTHAELGDGREDAALEIVESAPRLTEHPELATAVRQGVHDLVGDDAGQVWAKLGQSARAPWTPSGLMVLELYLDKAVLDSAWLMNPAGVPLPDLVEAPPVHLRPERIGEAVAALRARALAGDQKAGDDLAVECLRLVDLLVRAGVPDGPGSVHVGGFTSSTVGDELETEIERLAVPRLLDPGFADEYLRRVGTLDARTWATKVRPLVLDALEHMSVQGGPPLGWRVPAAAVAVLAAFPRLAGRDAAAALTWLQSADALDHEALLQAHGDAERRGVDDPWAMAALAVALVETSRGTAGPPEPLDVLVARARPTVEDLAALGTWLPDLPEDLVLPVLKEERASEALADLCARLDPIAWNGSVFVDPALVGDGVELLVRLRSASQHSRWWVGQKRDPDGPAWAAVVYALAVRAMTGVLPGVPMSQDLVAHAQAGWVLAALRCGPDAGLVPAFEPGVLDRVLTGDDAVVLDQVVREGIRLSLAAAVATVLSSGSPYANDAEHLAKLASVRSEMDGGVAPVLDHMIRRSLASGLVDPAELVEETSSAVRAFLAGTRGQVPDDAEVREHVQNTIKALDPRPRGATLGRFRRA